MQAFREFKRGLGPGQQDEPRQGHRAVPPRRAPPRGRSTHPARGAHALRVSRGGQPRRRRLAVRRRGEVPQDGRRRHVPVLHGHGRRAAHDARPRAAAVRDAAGGGRHGRASAARP
ncbi:MAG: hypothetical protein MZW92_53565 [Comamonadaceae bacterium]|nr:hypothetical protein [Comamonadaceae bacterium]